MDIDVFPDITMRGQDDPHARTLTPRPPTVGQLAARVGRLAGRPADWWRLARFEPDRTGRVLVERAGGVELWLTTWPPGHRTGVHDHASTGVTMVVAGELTEVAITADGVTERALRANRVRVHGGAHPHQLVNPGPAYAISLHARREP
ncbi:cysteine dioxygenase [Actinomadura craniellae]|uniref:Cysteine dioxygenase n=1 Tax=Actinomadura craniellae TaxID=2231787 RepID=A0A365H7K3_9ACTN|nr:cysteine dioxygenase family protein [Actinomadura craniellae]RAY15085.1 cysteine dioxygenase [Actinomadura craniellae]